MAEAARTGAQVGGPRVLVTGGAGFVGSTLVPLLLERGYRVRVLDNLTYGGEALLACFRSRRFEFIKGDVRSREDVRQAVKSCDAVIHLAAVVGYPACRRRPREAEEINVGGTRVVCDALEPGQLLLFASTGSTYGAIPGGVCSEETPLSPVSLYGETKTAAERLVRDRPSGVTYRFATAFGVAARLRLDLLINSFVYQALRRKSLIVYERSFMRTFIHVNDMAESIVFALENAGAMVGEVYNVGDESMNYSKQDICEMLRGKLDFYLHYAEVGTDGDQRNYAVDYSKLRSLGYRVRVGIDEGIDELIRGLGVINVMEPYGNA